MRKSNLEKKLQPQNIRGQTSLPKIFETTNYSWCFNWTQYVFPLTTSLYILGVSVPCPAFMLRQAINLARFLFAQTAHAKLMASCDDQTWDWNPAPLGGNLYRKCYKVQVHALKRSSKNCPWKWAFIRKFIWTNLWSLGANLLFSQFRVYHPSKNWCKNHGFLRTAWRRDSSVMN